MKKRVNQRAYPDPGQKQSLAQLFGCTRVIYNDYLTEAKRQYETEGKTDFSLVQKKVTTLAKNSAEREWLKDVSSVALQQSAQDARTAYRNFFKSCSGKRRGSKIGFPRYKKRTGKQKARFTKAAWGSRVPVEFDGCSKWGFLRIPKVGRVRFIVTVDLDWKSVSSVTIIKNTDDTYELSFVVDIEPSRGSPPEGTVCGIDRGLTDIAAIVSTSHGGMSQVVPNPKHLYAAERKLKRIHKEHSRKTNNSNNKNKSRMRLAKAYSKVSRKRKDFLDKLSSDIVDENQVICVEDLSSSDLAKTRMGKSVLDAGWGTFLQMLKYKAEEAGGEVVVIDRWFPSSQICSVCGINGGKKPLHVRVWECGSCHSVLDRDLNAAVNIIDAGGHSESLNACGDDVRLRLAGAIVGEAGTHRSDTTIAVGISTL